MKIGELAQKSGCAVVTIRYYEKEGLLPEPDRSGSNYRLYDESDMERLRFIRHCRQHGMKLAEIRELLAFREHPAPNCTWINTLVQRHIDNVEEQIASLIRLKDQLHQLLHACSGNNSGHCGILESLSAPCPHCGDLRCRETPPQPDRPAGRRGRVPAEA